MIKLEEKLKNGFSIVLFSDFTIGITVYHFDQLLIMSRTRTYLASDFNEEGEGVNVFICIIALFNCQTIPQGLVHTSYFLDIYNRYGKKGTLWKSKLFKEIYAEYISRERYKRTNTDSGVRVSKTS